MILGGLALINHAAGWAGLEPQFVESAADSLSEVTGLPHGDCAALVIVVGVLALYLVSRAVFGVLTSRGL